MVVAVPGAMPSAEASWPIGTSFCPPTKLGLADVDRLQVVLDRTGRKHWDFNILAKVFRSGLDCSV